MSHYKSSNQTKRNKQSLLLTPLLNKNLSSKSSSTANSIYTKLRSTAHSIINCSEFYFAMLITGLCILQPMEAFAAFDMDKAVTGVTQPVVDAIDKHWGKALMISGAGGTVIAQGDLKTRMIGFGTGVATGGLMMAGIKLGLGI